MNFNLIPLLLDHRYIGLIISLVIIFISIGAICFKYIIRHDKNKK